MFQSVAISKSKLPMTKQKIIQRFNLGAKTYDAAADIQISAAKELMNYLNTSAENILEIGCGTGLFSQYFIEKFPNKNILLTDIAPAMINISQNKFLNYSNVRTAYMDGENISLNASYDLIASNMTLHWFINLVDSVKKIIDRLNVGGRFVFTMLGENSLKEWRAIYPYILMFHKNELLKKNFPNMKINIKSYSCHYTDAHHFLKTLKQIGGTATNTSESVLSSGALRNILRRFDASFDVTYEIIYGQYIKT